MIKQLVFCFLLCFWVENLIAEDLVSSQPGEEAEMQPLQKDAQQRESLHELLAEIEKRYGETASQLKKLQRGIEQKNKILNKIRLEMSSLKIEVAKQNKELAGQIRSAYVMGHKEKLKLLLNQEDPGLSSRMMVYYNYLNKARLKRLEEINGSVKRLDQLEKEKQNESLLIEKNIERKISEQTVLEETKIERKELLAQINDPSFSGTDQSNYLLESENKLKNLLASLQNTENNLVEQPKLQDNANQSDDYQIEEPSLETEVVADASEVIEEFPNLKGKLPWPVRGKLVQKFGSPRSDSVWDGVLIDAKEGVDIRAVSWGKIVYSEWLRGYGLLIIVDHGNDFMSLYAFNQSLYKHSGDTVKAGEVIASVGQSGGRSQSGLYFEIRKKGIPIDPLEWCRKITQF
jgi:murein hydrolase activator